MFQLWVELDTCKSLESAGGLEYKYAGGARRTIDGLGLVGDSGELRVLGACDNLKSGRQLDELVKVTHVS